MHSEVRDVHPPRADSFGARYLTVWTWPRRDVAAVNQPGHSYFVHITDSAKSLIPSAPLDDLDLDVPEDEEEWDRRVMDLATARIAAERVRLERVGIIDANGDLVSQELPPDMCPESDTTL